MRPWCNPDPEVEFPRLKTRMTSASPVKQRKIAPAKRKRRACALERSLPSRGTSLPTCDPAGPIPQSAPPWPPSPAGGTKARMGVGGFGSNPSEAVRPLRGRFRRRRPPSRSRRQLLHIARGPQRTTSRDQSTGNTERRDHTLRALTPQTFSPVAGTLTLSERRHVAHDTRSAPSPRASACKNFCFRV